jgi:Asp/Glu/hydantoin racemase
VEDQPWAYYFRHRKTKVKQLRGVQMRVVAITPIHVTDEELARRQERYTRLAPAGLTVELRNLSTASPVALDLQSDVLSSDAALMDDMCHVKADVADVVMPDCVLDPGFRPGSNDSVVGMLESVTAHLVAQGHKIGAVTRIQHEEHCETIEEYQGSSDITAEVHDGQRTGDVEHGEVFGDYSLQGVQ